MTRGQSRHPQAGDGRGMARLRAATGAAGGGGTGHMWHLRAATPRQIYTSQIDMSHASQA